MFRETKSDISIHMQIHPELANKRRMTNKGPRYINKYLNYSQKEKKNNDN